MRRFLVIVAIVFAMLPSGASAQTSTVPPIAGTYCITVMQDEFDYTADPAALVEAILAGDVTIMAVTTECPVATDAYVTYGEWVTHVNTSKDALARTVKGLSSSATLARTIRAYRAIRAWAEGELTWLDATTPNPCWQAEYDQWRVGATEVRDGIAKALRGISNGDLGAVKAATSLTLKGLSKVTGVITMESPDCVV